MDSALDRCSKLCVLASLPKTSKCGSSTDIYKVWMKVILSFMLFLLLHILRDSPQLHCVSIYNIQVHYEY